MFITHMKLAWRRRARLSEYRSTQNALTALAAAVLTTMIHDGNLLRGDAVCEISVCFQKLYISCQLILTSRTVKLAYVAVLYEPLACVSV